MLSQAWNATEALLGPALSRLSPSSRVIGPPKGFYNTTLEYWTAYKENQANEYIKLTESEEFFNLIKPVTIDSVVHKNFLNRVSYQIAAQFIAHIPGGRVLGDNCMIIAPDDKLLGDVSRQFKVNEDFGRMKIFKTIKLPRITRLNGLTAVAGYAGGSYNYFHWTFDVLPRLLLLERSGWLEKCDQVIINELKMPFHHESLSLLNLPVQKFVFSHDKVQYDAEQLLIPSVPDTGDFLPDWSLQALKKKYDEGMKRPIIIEAPKIYISRRHAKKRKVLNEEALIQLLIGEGFQVFSPEKMSLEEQAALYRQAEIIIAPHGASQVNLLFCHPGATIIEIFSEKWVNPCYWGLANRLDLRYGYLIGGESWNDNAYGVESDVVVDIQEMQKLLNKVLMESKK
ncbi:glycosyltransferase family 61 protein [Pseudobacter ginsenosidimutans]|uniref:glycosyltransferase family 61 protein n=1 Tax=Pseudobacter ginsenosidimutans TaxID=661488 RepID=UPI0011BB6246|nr:glycosyltransferase family 61 protein [Pseudobacter ginsenosidimutans]QEC41038.1 glycosyltransferase family 61 protein [Pseudobacter ginsenosidimutans]